MSNVTSVEPLTHIKKAYQDGLDAFFSFDPQRKMQVANPFKNGTMLAKEWQRGFDKSFTDNAKRVDVV